MPKISPEEIKAGVENGTIEEGSLAVFRKTPEMMEAAKQYLILAAEAASAAEDKNIDYVTASAKSNKVKAELSEMIIQNNPILLTTNDEPEQKVKLGNDAFKKLFHFVMEVATSKPGMEDVARKVSTHTMHGQNEPGLGQGYMNRLAERIAEKAVSEGKVSFDDIALQKAARELSIIVDARTLIEDKHLKGRHITEMSVEESKVFYNDIEVKNTKESYVKSRDKLFDIIAEKIGYGANFTNDQTPMITRADEQRRFIEYGVVEEVAGKAIEFVKANKLPVANEIKNNFGEAMSADSIEMAKMAITQGMFLEDLTVASMAKDLAYSKRNKNQLVAQNFDGKKIVGLSSAETDKLFNNEDIKKLIDISEIDRDKLYNYIAQRMGFGKNFVNSYFTSVPGRRNKSMQSQWDTVEYLADYIEAQVIQQHLDVNKAPNVDALTTYLQLYFGVESKEEASIVAEAVANHPLGEHATGEEQTYSSVLRIELMKKGVPEVQLQEVLGRSKGMLTSIMEGNNYMTAIKDALETGEKVIIPPQYDLQPEIVSKISVKKNPDGNIVMQDTKGVLKNMPKNTGQGGSFGFGDNQTLPKITDATANIPKELLQTSMSEEQIQHKVDDLMAQIDLTGRLYPHDAASKLAIAAMDLQNYYNANKQDSGIMEATGSAGTIIPEALMPKSARKVAPEHNIEPQVEKRYTTHMNGKASISGDVKSQPVDELRKKFSEARGNLSEQVLLAMPKKIFKSLSLQSDDNIKNNDTQKVIAALFRQANQAVFERTIRDTMAEDYLPVTKDLAKFMDEALLIEKFRNVDDSYLYTSSHAVRKMIVDNIQMEIEQMQIAGSIKPNDVYLRQKNIIEIQNNTKQIEQKVEALNPVFDIGKKRPEIKDLVKAEETIALRHLRTTNPDIAKAYDQALAQQREAIFRS